MATTPVKAIESYKAYMSTHNTREGIEELIKLCGRNLRSISWHSDGRVIAKAGAGAKNPRKLYSAYTPKEALEKLLKDNSMTTPNKVEEIIEYFNNQFTDHDDGTFTVGLDTRYATKEDFIEFIRVNLHQKLQKAREEALAREKQLKQVHMMELDAISCKSIEDFVIWRDHRKQRPNQSELDQPNK